MQDFEKFFEVAINGVKLIPIVIGLMEVASTHFGLKGRALVISAIVVLLGVGTMSGMMASGLMPEAALPWIDVVSYAMGFLLAGLAAMGLHDWSKQFRPAPGPETMHRPQSGR